MGYRFLFLVADMQPFLAAGLRALQLRQPDAEVLVYCRDMPGNTLLDIQPGGRLRIFTYAYEPEPFFWDKLNSFKPDVAWCAGWMFPRYLSWIKALRQTGTKTICAMDTQWKGTLRQRLLTAVAPYSLRRCFDYAWVPGRRQEQYAVKLGFAAPAILHHLYAPDTALFGQAFAQRTAGAFPKRFLYCGRLEAHKIAKLVSAFGSLDEGQRQGWCLQLIGNGSLEQEIKTQYPGIDIMPARSQKDLVPVLKQGGVFCLCSRDEPWGTVAQEFAAAGFPLLLSRQCGSSEHFLEGNGLLCDGADTGSIKAALLSFIALPGTELQALGKRSHELGMRSGSGTWAAVLCSIL